MAQQVLDRAQVRAARQQMRGERVPQRMRRRVLRQAVQPAEVAAACAAPPPGPAACRARRGTAGCPAAGPGAAPARRRPPRAPPAAPARSAPCRPCPPRAAVRSWQRRIAHIERQRLGDAQPTAVQQREQRRVARLDRRGCPTSRRSAPSTSRAWPCRQRARHRALAARRGDQLQRRIVHAMPARQEAKEAAHRGQVPRAGGIAGALGRLGRQPGAQIRPAAAPASAARSGSPPRCCVRNPRKPGEVGAVGLHRQRRGAALLPEPVEEGNCRASSPVIRVSGRVPRPRRGRGSRAGPVPCAGSSMCRIARQQGQQRRRPLARHAHQRIVPRQPRGFGMQQAAHRLAHRGTPPGARPAAAPTVPSGSGRAPGMLRLDAQMRRVDRQDARHLAADAVRRIGASAAAPAPRPAPGPPGPRSARPGRQQRRRRARAGPAASPPCGRPAPRHARRAGGSSTRYSSGCSASQAGLARRNASTNAASASAPGRSPGAPPPSAAGSCRCGSGDLLAGLGPVGQERRQALVGQRMVEQLPQDRRRHGGDMRAQLGGLHHMHRVAHRGDQHLGLEVA